MEINRCRYEIKRLNPLIRQCLLRIRLWRLTQRCCLHQNVRRNGILNDRNLIFRQKYGTLRRKMWSYSLRNQISLNRQNLTFLIKISNQTHVLQPPRTRSQNCRQNLRRCLKLLILVRWINLSFSQNHQHEKIIKIKTWRIINPRILGTHHHLNWYVLLYRFNPWIMLSFNWQMARIFT